jgi:hypothetical protein
VRAENIYDVLGHVENRKAMFLGNDYTFQTLNTFVTGYMMAAQESQLKKANCPNFTYFSVWIIGHLEEHYGFSFGWHWQIRNRNPGNDEKAFEEFFYFLEVFKNSTVSSRTVIVDQVAITGTEMKDELIEEKPYKIRWIQMTNSTMVWIKLLDKNEKLISDRWYLNEMAANEFLKGEFGTFKNDWVEEVGACKDLD